ncbi:DUF397 domain-containing protein [Nocardia crassostreae]|uniref:DUF397 domain-containing protein n=1 Tax=Nocardia crassostreae TaxID=53428 RepID=UPI0009FCEA92|nr:DUF397 domain-containing protein [Nocardia crassostreae]
MNVELSDARWFKSSHSQAGGECVEVAFLSKGNVGVRDSQDRGGAALIFERAEWNSFVAAVVVGF